MHLSCTSKTLPGKCWMVYFSLMPSSFFLLPKSLPFALVTTLLWQQCCYAGVQFIPATSLVRPTIFGPWVTGSTVPWLHPDVDRKNHVCMSRPQWLHQDSELQCILGYPNPFGLEIVQIRIIANWSSAACCFSTAWGTYIIEMLAAATVYIRN